MAYVIYFVLLLITTETSYELRQIEKVNPERKPLSFTNVFSYINYFFLLLVNMHLWGNLVGIILSVLGYIGFISVTVGWIIGYPSTVCDIMFRRPLEQINRGTIRTRRSLPVIAGINLLFFFYLYYNIQDEILLQQFKTRHSLIVIAIIVLVVGFVLRILLNRLLLQFIEYRHAKDTEYLKTRRSEDIAKRLN